MGHGHRLAHLDDAVVRWPGRNLVGYLILAELLRSRSNKQLLAGFLRRLAKHVVSSSWIRAVLGLSERLSPPNITPNETLIDDTFAIWA